MSLLIDPDTRSSACRSYFLLTNRIPMFGENVEKNQSFPPHLDGSNYSLISCAVSWNDVYVHVYILYMDIQFKIIGNWARPLALPSAEIVEGPEPKSESLTTVEGRTCSILICNLIPLLPPNLNDHHWNSTYIPRKDGLKKGDIQQVFSSLGFFVSILKMFLWMPLHSYHHQSCRSTVLCFEVLRICTYKQTLGSI